MLEMLKERKAALEAQGKKGFTLMEMLIVIAIIAVLVAIAIPIFANQLENSREATDAANIRSAYAEVAAAALNDPGTAHSATVKKQQTQADWQSASSIKNIAGVAITAIQSTGDTTVSYDANSSVVKIDGTAATNSFMSSSSAGTGNNG